MPVHRPGAATARILSTNPRERMLCRVCVSTSICEEEGRFAQAGLEAVNRQPWVVHSLPARLQDFAALLTLQAGICAPRSVIVPERPPPCRV